MSIGDIMLVDGGLSTFKILSKTDRDVHMEVVDGGRMTSRCNTLHVFHLASVMNTAGGGPRTAKSLSRPALLGFLTLGPCLTVGPFRRRKRETGPSAARRRVAPSALHLRLSIVWRGRRRHLNIRGKSANLPAITDKDWLDLKFGIDVGVDYYALSFVRSADVIYELKDYLQKQGAFLQNAVAVLKDFMTGALAGGAGFVQSADCTSWMRARRSCFAAA